MVKTRSQSKNMIGGTSAGSASSKTSVVAQRLALEAQHARRVAEIEMGQIQAEREERARAAAAERAAVDAELRADIAALESRSSRGSRASHAPSQTSAQYVENWVKCHSNIKSCTQFQVEHNGHASAKEGLSPNLAEVSMPPPAPLLFQCDAPKAGSTIEPNIATTTHACVGTHHISKDNCNNNINKVSDITQFTEAIKSLARTRRKVSDLPIFSGSPKDWLCFQKCFERTKIHFENTDNLLRLSTALRGAAREAVATLLVTSDDPHVVMNALEQQFGNPEIVVLNAISEVKLLPKIGNFDTGKDLNYVTSKVRNCVTTIKLLNHFEHLASPELVNIILGKLSPLLREKWVDFAFSHQRLGTYKLELLSDFLIHEAHIHTKFGILTDFVPRERGHQEKSHFLEVKEKANSNEISFTDKVKSSCSCTFCQSQSHEISACARFLSMSIDGREKWVTENKVCRKCLIKGGHRYAFCKKTCTVANCKTRRHHRLLHRNDVTNYNVNVEDVCEDTHDQNNPVASTSFSSQQKDNVNIKDQAIVGTTSTSVSCSLRPLLKVIPVTVCGPAGSIDTYALLDDGSTGTFIDADIAERIGAKGPEGHIHLDCVGGLSRDSSVQYVDFKIRGKFSSDTFVISKARSIKNLGLVAQTVTYDSLRNYSYLNDLAEMLSYDVAKPTLIIGIDNWHLTVSHETRKGSKSQPVAIRTVLGWVLFGFSTSKTKPIDCITACTISSFDFYDPKLELENLIKEQYKLDALGITKHEPRSNDDERALEILKRTARRQASGRFEVGLLWKEDSPNVPDSYPLALSRFHSLERKMLKDPLYAERYRKNMQVTFKKGYAEDCTGQTPGSICWYLPHFGVINPNKPAKLRVVHDAAAKSNGVSLNSLLLLGPDLLRPLLGVLMRFREGKIALTADIQEMFPQIKIQEHDRNAQRFLWRDSPEEPIKTYRMSSMMFGTCSSPCTAIYIMNLNASEYRDEFPEAVDAIKRDTYMDDYIGSTNNPANAARLAADITTVHSRGGFKMRDWVSNDSESLSLLPNELVSALITSVDCSVDLGSSAFVRTLGLIWFPFKDIISFSSKLSEHSPEHFTKRAVLAQVMRIYDPLGLLAPIVVRGRILFQNLWRKKLQWDEELSERDQMVWREWFDGLKSLSYLQIPRCYNTSENEVVDLELHVFCDASELAHVAVAYWRFTFSNGGVRLALIMSKARVSPLKPVSIPRLELQAALLATRLAGTICSSHRYRPSRRFFWSDSMIVLGWLRNDARKFKPFVAHRVGEILESSALSEWRWIPSDLNVADDATRDSRNSLSIESRWFIGPEFLLSSPSDWPVEPLIVHPVLDEKVELKPSFKSHCNISSKSISLPDPLFSEIILFNNTSHFPLPVVVNMTHFSSWQRLVRATARLHQFIALIFKKVSHNFSNPLLHEIVLNFFPQELASTVTAPATQIVPLNAEAIRRAETHILRQCQLSAFKKDLLSLTNGTQLHSKSRVACLSPALNEDGLMFLRGRISAASGLPREVTRPIILCGKEHAVRLLIYHFHCKFAHANTETILNELRQQYWILGVRNAVKSVSRSCQLCKLLKAPTLRPPMGDLPEDRLAHHRRPFSVVGVDYFGPLQVAIGRRREKRWVALFTCMVTRAIHLEVVYSLSADAAIMCIRRLIAQRGSPSTIWSDNGTAFVGANRQLQALYDQAVSDFTADQKIEWRFIPPSAPFMGGAWERMVRSVKTALSVTLKDRTPTDEILYTLLKEAEAIVNARPLTHVSPDPDFPEALTPYHFLIGESSGRPLPVHLTDSDLCGRSGWRKALRLADHFWRRWVTEYLPTLAPRRVPGSISSVKPGDLVLIGDGDLPRGTWPRGVVEAVFPGRDGIVRVVDIRTVGGVLRRPLKKVVLL